MIPQSHNELSILHLEDNALDAELIRETLKNQGIFANIISVDSEIEFREALKNGGVDLVLSDYSLPGFGGMSALKILLETTPGVPFIFVSGTIGEDIAIESLKNGATDYVLKQRLQRLALSVRRALREVEERKRRAHAEESLRLQSAAVEAAANAIMITNAKGKIIWVNPAFTETSGYSAAEVLGKTPRLLKSGKQPPEFYKVMWETILAGEVWHSAIVNRRKDGSLIEEDLTITPILNEEREITHFVGIKQDITELKNTEQALQETNERLQEALFTLQAKSDEVAAMTQQLWQASKLATMGELAASIAHELNNPLATVGLRAESLLDQLDESDPKRPALGVISQEVERMGNLVGNLLTFSRRSHQQISTIEIREELSSSLDLIHYHLRSHKIDVVKDFAHALPTIQADRQQLRQVFLNLLTNASDAMPNGGAITVRARPAVLDDKDALLIEISDTGTGINEADLPKLWEPFFTTKAEGKGTGLGLAICRRTIEEHKGTISISSHPGDGTTVSVLLPTTTQDVSHT